MKRAFAMVVLIHSLQGSLPVWGQIKQFPYEAKVVVNETFVRSGAGDPDKYYPTQKLTKDAVVNVLRHDPGGWYMIDPPEGSFSWVPERFVKKLSDSEGEISEEDIVAWVGSEFGDEASVWQCKLKTGDKVKILGSRTIDTTSGLQKMLQIQPPAREHRWIPGAALVPVDEQRRREFNSDPYTVPGNAKRPDGPLVTPDQVLKARTKISEGVTDVPPVTPSSQLAHLQQLRNEQQRLADIDRRFREMILQDAATWDLDSIEREYLSLQESATQKQISGQIDMRFPAIERYRRRMTRAMDIKQITSQTEMRDAALVARHQGYPGFVPPPLSSPGPESVRIPGQTPQLAEAFEQFLQRDSSNIASSDPAGTVAPELVMSEQPDSATAIGTSPIQNASGEFTPSNGSASTGEKVAGNVLTPGSPQNQYIGAGIVQRAPEGSAGSGYVLMAPSGKILADLKPTGSVRLEQFVGQQVGVQGARWSEKEKRDIIEVSAMEPVRLRQ